jgi:hypothetical protein
MFWLSCTFSCLFVCLLFCWWWCGRLIDCRLKSLLMDGFGLNGAGCKIEWTFVGGGGPVGLVDCYHFVQLPWFGGASVFVVVVEGLVLFLSFC